jgi:hypothetical protein
MDRHTIILFLTAAVACAQPPQTPPNGIWVAPPKVYDDAYLQTRLNALKASLGNVTGFDQTTLTNALGTIQGATANSSGFAIQAGGPGTSQTSTLTPPPASALSDSTGTALTNLSASGAYGTTFTGPASATPTIPTAPASTLTLPSTFGSSAIGALSKEMQLNYQILNTQLLLDGSLNDTIGKHRATVGFTIAIDAPESLKKQLKNAVAEVDVTLENPRPVSGATLEAPSVITLLPRENTYDVLGMVQHSLSIGGGAILAGMVNLGASWGFNKQKAYLYQQQSTLAMERRDAPSKARFVWQFRPTLDREYLDAGTRQTFVQFSLPDIDPTERNGCEAFITVRTHWRAMEPKTGLISEDWIEPRRQTFPLPYFETLPISETVKVTDMGGGNVSVLATGRFLPGMIVRVGPQILGPASTGFQLTPDSVEFVASAADLISGGAYLVGRDGHERLLQDGLNDKTRACQIPPAPTYTIEEKGAAVTSLDWVKPATPEAPKSAESAAAAPAIFSIALDAHPFSDSQTRLKITLNNPPHDSGDTTGGSPGINPLVTVIGGQVFGLRNAPYLTKPGNQLELLVSTDLLRASDKVVAQRLLGGTQPTTSASADLNLGEWPRTSFAVSGASLIANSDPLFILVSGSGLDGAALLASAVGPPPDKCPPPPASGKPADAPAGCVADPRPCFEIRDTQPTYLLVTLRQVCLSQSKQFFVTKNNFLPLAVTVPQVKADPPKAVNLSATVIPGAKVVPITGAALDQITAISIGKTSLGYILSLDKKTALLTVPPDLTATVGIRSLDILLADGTKQQFLLTVK